MIDQEIKRLVEELSEEFNNEPFNGCLEKELSCLEKEAEQKILLLKERMLI